MLIGTFAVPLDAVALEHTFAELPELEVEAERIAATSTKWVMPCLWVASDDSDAVAEAFRNDPTINSIVESADFEDETYYQVEWADSVKAQFDAYLDMKASILAASASSSGWRLRVRFASREQFDALRDHLTDQGHSFELRELVEPGSPRQSQGGLTPDQRNALVTALEHGYYDVPRDITARELADELDMSHQALSSLLRRGTANLVESLLKTSESDEN